MRCFVLLALALASAAFADTPRTHEPDTAPQAIATPDDATQWLTYYYVWPTPALTVPAFTRLAGEVRPQTRGPLAMFFAQVFRQNESRIAEWSRALAEGPAEARALLATTLWYADTSGARRALASLPAASRADVHADMAPPDPRTLPLDSAAALDLVWAAFFATGDDALLGRLAALLPALDDPWKPDAEKRVNAAAQWSLLTNAIQHRRVLAYCETGEATSAMATRALRRIAVRARADRARDHSGHTG